MTDHADEDGEEGEEEGSNEELFAALQTVLLAGLETCYGHGGGEEPQPLPHQRGGHEQLLHLQHEHIKSIQDLRGELQHHQEQEEVVQEDGPLQSVLVLGAEK